MSSAKLYLFNDGRVAAVFEGILGSDERFIQKASASIKDYDKVAYSLLKVLTGSDQIFGLSPYAEEMEAEEGKSYVCMYSMFIAEISSRAKMSWDYTQAEKEKINDDLAGYIKSQGISDSESMARHPVMTLLRSRIVDFCHDNVDVCRDMYPELFVNFVGSYKVGVCPGRNVYVDKCTYEQISKMTKEGKDWIKHQRHIIDFKLAYPSRFIIDEEDKNI